MTQTTTPAVTTVTSLVLEVGRLVRSRFREHSEDFGLSQPQWLALAHLNKSPGLTQSELAERLEVSKVTVTQLVDRLEKAGWLRREAHESDRRAVRLQLTDKAEPVSAALWRVGAQVRAQALTGFSAAERQQLEALLQRMKTNLGGGPAGKA